MFFILDAKFQYCQISTDRKCVDKSSFVAQNELHKDTGMPYILINARATFQRALDVELATEKWLYGLVYNDKIFIYLNTFEHHPQYIEELL